VPREGRGRVRALRRLTQPMADSVSIWITLRLATVSTLILLCLGTPLAWWLARTRSYFKTPIEATVALPLVLPPTVLGFYLLIALAPNGWLGAGWQALGGASLAFSFTGLVIGSVLYSMPFVVQPLQNAFEGLGARPWEAAATLRASPLDRFFSVAVPLARRGFITAATLGFAHTVGEFGVVLMIGGNIPGKTQVLSIAIYDHVETLEYAEAHRLSAGLLAFSFAVLIVVALANRRHTRRGP
jgi:molybdate transport system permease protein